MSEANYNNLTLLNPAEDGRPVADLTGYKIY